MKPGIPEFIDDCDFPWFEDEYVIDVARRWVLAASAADAPVKSQSKEENSNPRGTPQLAILELRGLCISGAEP